jgi:TrmH family RNA methyltransferase
MHIGKHNRKLQQIRKALRQGALTPDGLLPIEGPILLEEAQRSGVEVVDVLLRSGTANPAPSCGEGFELPADVFKTIQETEHSQGVVATVRPRRFTQEQVLAGRTPLVVVLCRLQDPGNVGTILRVAEAFGATGCVALRGTAGLHNSKVVRASAGSIFRLPHIEAANLDEIAGSFRAKGIQIAGAAPASDATVEKWNWRQPAAILIGNEGAGLNPEELRYCDTVLCIPHKSTVQSLNSAIAAAVILYEAAKQRRAL